MADPPTPMDTTEEKVESNPSEEEKRVEEAPSGQFELSCVLIGHEYAVRDVGVLSNDLLATCGERGKMSVWERSGDISFTKRELYPEKMHGSGLAFCLTALPPGTARGFPPESFVSGGADKAARPWTAGGEKLPPLTGHSNVVNCVSFTSTGELITGDWDGTIRFWEDGKLSREVKGLHTHAVEVLGLATGEVVSGSGNKSLLIFGPGASTPTLTIPNAHNHNIRKIVPHGLGFATCGNDGMVKVWSNTGEELISIAAHCNDPKFDKFAYCVAVLPSGELVSCGEDGTARVWSSDGATLQQTLRFPGAVRAVDLLPNGDLIACCADRTARIFTRDPKRYAAAQTRAEFTELGALVKASGMKQMDSQTLPDETALLKPGDKDGAIKVVRVTNRGAIVYKWTAATLEWEEFGEALGQRETTKTELYGVEYDHVTDVVIAEGHSAKLGFNNDDDPQEVAVKFCSLHNLSPDMRYQIAEHVRPLTDHNLYTQRMEIEAEAKAAEALQHVPAWETGGLQYFSEIKTKQMQSKVLELNEGLKSAGNEFVLNEKDLEGFTKLVDTLSDPTRFTAPTFNKQAAKTMVKLIQWPSAQAAPVMDAYRALMIHTAPCNELGTNPTVQKALLAHANTSPVLLALLLKALTNWIARRTKTRQERASPPSLPQDLSAFVAQVLDVAATAATAGKASLVAAYVMFAYNCVCWLGRLKVEECEHYLVMASALCEVLAAPSLKEKTRFYALLTLGSLAYASAVTKLTLKEGFTEQIHKCITSAKASSNKATIEVGGDLEKIFR